MDIYRLLLCAALICKGCVAPDFPIPDPAVCAAAWTAITGVYQWWTEQDVKAPQPLLVLESDVFAVPPMLPVIWHQHIDGEQMTYTPFQTLYEAVPELVKRYPADIDPNTCKLEYKLGENLGIVQITNDKMVEEMLKKGPDFEDQYRRVFIKCPGIESCNAGQCSADKLSDDESNVQYQLAMNSYRYSKGHQIPRDEAQIEKYEQGVEDMGLSDFDISSEAVQVVQQDLKIYEKEHEKRCKSYGWETKIKQTAWDAIHADVINRADSDIVFDSETWTLKGYWVRFSSFLNENKDKISYTFTTSNFEIKVPEDQKEQSFIEKYVTGGGKLKNKFSRMIMHLLRADGQESSTYNTAEPMAIMFRDKN